jgi:hypothetical protein
LLICFSDGLRNGGGIGDVLPRPSIDESLYFERYFFDLIFFFMVIILLLNIIFGIILDTFAALRELKEEREDLLNNHCFICSLNRDQLEKIEEGFEYHTRREHNTWEYLYFIIYIKTKEPSEYTGIESYIAEKLAANDVSFVPLYHSLSLEQQGLKEEGMIQLTKKVERLELMMQDIRQTSKRIDKVEEALNNMLTEVVELKRKRL